GLRRERVALACAAPRRPRRQRPLARRHARVVHDLAAAAAQLRHRPLRDERAPAARPAATARGADMTGIAPGPWLRVTAPAAAAALPGRHVHAGLAACACAALLVVCVRTFRGERVPWGSWRDYAALTKPRIMVLLLVTGFCGMIAGARGWPGSATAAAAMAG